jgi:hypothetical protein
MVVIKLDGLKGEKGETGSGTNIFLRENDVNVLNTPHTILNFGNGLSVTDNGGGKATIDVSAGGGSPTANLLQLVDTVGNQNLNDVSVNPIEWGGTEFIDSEVFSFTNGNSNITVLKTGIYEISFNINGAAGGNRTTIGVQFRKNGSVISKTLTASYTRNASNNDSNNSLVPCTISLSANDVLDVVAFRLGDSTKCSSKANASFVKIKYLGS